MKRNTYLILLIFGALFGQEEKIGLEELLFSPEFVITATKIITPISEVPASVTIITEEDIERYGFETLADVLNYTLGTYTTTDRANNFVGVRGMFRLGDYNTRILILLNGHVLNEVWNMYVDIGEALGINMENVKKIEIVRGPGSALYGTSAFFAVINFITKEGKEINGLIPSFEIGSFEKYKGKLLFGKKIGKFDIFLSGSYLDYKGPDLFLDTIFLDPEVNLPVRFGTGDSIYIWGGKAKGCDYENGWTFLGNIKVSDFSFLSHIITYTAGIPLSDYESAFGDKRNKVMDKHEYFELKYSKFFERNKSITLKGYFNHYKYLDWYVYPDTSYQGDGYIFRDEGNPYWSGSEIQITYPFFDWFNFLIGGEFQIKRVSQAVWEENIITHETFEESYIKSEDKSWFSSFYLENNLKPKNYLDLLLSARLDYYSTFGGAITPRIAVCMYPKKGTTLKLIYNRAFRAPSVYEYSFTDWMSILSNYDLKPEFITSYEISLTQNLMDKLKVDFSIFLNHLTNLISDAEVESTVISPSGDTIYNENWEQYRNIGRAKNIGFELGIKSNLREKIDFFANFTFNDSKEDEKGNGNWKWMPNSPKFYLSMGTSYEIINNRLWLSLMGRFLSKRLTRENDTLPHQHTIDLYLKTQDIFIKDLKIFIKVKNLLNSSLYDPLPVYFTPDRVKLDGISINAGISYKLKL